MKIILFVEQFPRIGLMPLALVSYKEFLEKGHKSISHYYITIKNGGFPVIIIYIDVGLVSY